MEAEKRRQFVRDHRTCIFGYARREHRPAMTVVRPYATFATDSAPEPASAAAFAARQASAPRTTGADSARQPQATDQRFAQLERNLAAIASRLHDRAPDCRVLFVDYLTILPPDGRGQSAPPPPDIAAWGREIAPRLAATTQSAANAAGCGYVAASAASADHHAWSEAPWTRRFHLSLRGGAPYHPNVAGMTAVADLIVAALGEQTA